MMIKLLHTAVILVACLALTASVSAQEECTNNDEALRTCEGDLKGQQKEAAKLKSEMAGMVPNSGVKDAESATSKAEAKVAQLEKELKAAQAQVTKLQEAAEASKAEAKKAKSAVSSLEKELSQVKASSKITDGEAAKLRTKAEQAERALQELASHHHTAWLPHWLDETVGKYAADAHVTLSRSAGATKDAVQKGSLSAYAAWKKHGAPRILQAAEFLKAKAASGIAAGSKHLEQRGIKLPTSVFVAKEAVQRTVKAFFSSNAAARAVDAVKAAGGIVREQAGIVVVELENVIVQASKSHPSLAPLADKPLSSVAVYSVLCLPLLAIGMPLMASRRSKVPQPGGSTASGRVGAASGGHRTPGQKSSVKKSGGRGRY